MKILSTTDSKGKKVLLSSQSSSKKKSTAPLSNFTQMMAESTEETILSSLLDDPQAVLSNISLLAEELDRIGAELSENPTIETFNNYKKHIRLLVKSAIQNYQITETRTLKKNSVARYNQHHTAQSIDQLLAELAEKFIKDEQNRMDLLDIANQIKGLILDIII